MRSLMLLGAAVTAPLAAQTLTFTTPTGYDTADSNHQAFFHWNNQPRRMQVVDNTNKGAPKPNLKSVAFRRAYNGGGTTSIQRTFDVTFQMGDAVWGTTTVHMGQTYKGQPTIVYAKKQLTVPDWTQAPTTPPAAWDLIIPFDAPYHYIGVDALVWDLFLENGSGSGSMDRQYVSASTRTYSVTYGSPGCVAGDWVSRSPQPQMLASMSADNAGTGGIGLQASTTWAPIGSFPLFMFDNQPQNIQVPNLCSSIFALPIQTLTGGPATTTSGYVSLPELRVPYDVKLEGATLFLQTVALDPLQPPPTIPLVVSTGVQVTVPVAPPPGVECLYQWQTPIGAPATFTFFGGAPLAQFRN